MSSSQLTVGAALLTWLAVIGSGMSYLAFYDQQAGQAAAPPLHIAPLVASVPQQQRLFMFVHPHCPCSVASLRELQRLMSRCAAEIDALVYFIRPESETDSWVQGNLWNLAKKTPGTRVEIDAGGRLAQQFAATTSGSIVVYDAAGRLRYHGGITFARGHEGDSRGKAAIFALARGEASNVAACPVYGCPLRDSAHPVQLEAEK